MHILHDAWISPYMYLKHYYFSIFILDDTYVHKETAKLVSLVEYDLPLTELCGNAEVYDVKVILNL